MTSTTTKGTEMNRPTAALLAAILGSALLLPVACDAHRHTPAPATQVVFSPNCHHLDPVDWKGCDAALLQDSWSYAGTIDFPDSDEHGTNCYQLTADELNAYFDCPDAPIGIAGA